MSGNKNHIQHWRLMLIDGLAGWKVRKILRQLHNHQFLPEEVLNSYRNNAYHRLKQIAITNSSFYRQYQPQDEFPIVNKALMKKNPAAFISKGYQGRIIKKFTGGTTGTPFGYLSSVEAQSYLWAGLLLSWEQCGYQVGDRVAFVAGNALIKSGIKNRFFYRLLNIDQYPVSLMDEETISRHLKNITEKKSKLIYGYAMALNIMADYLLRHDKKPPAHLLGIVSTSEVLTPAMRDNIEKAFGVKVYNQYGCSESGATAFECKEGKMHLISSRCIYETGENGNLISTDLANYASMFIRYDTGDILKFTDTPCNCGITYPVVAEITGRSNELLYDQANKKVHTAFFNSMFKKNQSIIQYQVVYDETHLRINLHSDETLQEREIQQYLDLIKTQLKFSSYEITLNKNFETSKNMKHSFIIDNRKKKNEAMAE